jgi:methionine synthase II (cobalamin-independent)
VLGARLRGPGERRHGGSRTGEKANDIAAWRGGVRSRRVDLDRSWLREQYEDAVSVHLRAQETAGLDICTDGDAHYDDEVGGMSWQSYPLRHMSGFNAVAEPAIYNVGAVAYPRGHILHDYLEARVFPRIVGPVGPGNLQYAAMWKMAQRLTTRPVKFGTILPELLAASALDSYYKDPVERTMALGEALNKELNDLADAGCPVIQMEEPQIHMVPARGKTFGKLDVRDLVGVFNRTVKDLRAKTSKTRTASPPISPFRMAHLERHQGCPVAAASMDSSRARPRPAAARSTAALRSCRASGSPSARRIS